MVYQYSMALLMYKLAEDLHDGFRTLPVELNKLACDICLIFMIVRSTELGIPVVCQHLARIIMNPRR